MVMASAGLPSTSSERQSSFQGMTRHIGTLLHALYLSFERVSGEVELFCRYGVY